MILHPNGVVIQKENLVDFLTIALIGLGLAADAFAVAIVKSMADKRMPTKKYLVISAYFGVFQAGMIILGWFLGLQFLSLAAGVSNWIAFGLFMIIGGKMIYESRTREKEAELDHRTLLMLAIATSIDAFVVGLTLSYLGISIIEAALSVGAITFVVSLIGCFLGKRYGHILGEWAEIAGGLMIIALGVKIIL